MVLIFVNYKLIQIIVTTNSIETAKSWGIVFGFGRKLILIHIQYLAQNIREENNLYYNKTFLLSI